jgi:hypothetical protein
MIRWANCLIHTKNYIGLGLVNDPDYNLTSCWDVYIFNECEMLNTYKEDGRLAVSRPLRYLSFDGSMKRARCMWDRGVRMIWHRLDGAILESERSSLG